MKPAISKIILRFLNSKSAIYNKLANLFIRMRTCQVAASLEDIINSKEQTRIVIQCSLGYIGHMIWFTVLFKVLKTRYPHIYLAVIIAKNTVPILENNPYVDEIIITNSSPRQKRTSLSHKEFFQLWSFLRKSSFDLVIDMEPYLDEMLVTACAGIRYRVGLLDERQEYDEKCYTGFIYMPFDENYLLSLRRLVELLGIPWRENYRPMIVLNEEEKNWADTFFDVHKVARSASWIGLHPGASRDNHMWPEKRWVSLIKELNWRYSPHLLLFGSTDEIELTRKIAETCKLPVINMAGKISLREAVTLIRKLNLLICNNSGLMHVAISQGTSVIVLSGPSQPRWSVNGPLGIEVRKNQCPPCDARVCQYGTNECMETIEVSDVIKAVEQLLIGQERRV